MNPRSHGANRAAHRRCGIRVAQFVQVTQHDGLTEPDGQRGKGPAERGDVPLPVDIGQRIGLNGQLDRKSVV